MAASVSGAMRLPWGPRPARRSLTLAVLAVMSPILPTGTVPPATAAEQVPAPPDLSWTVAAVRAEPLHGTTVRVGGRGEHRGAIEVLPSSGGLGVVADLPLEHYVMGIAEISSRWPLEALKAQAIAARTYALSEMGGRATTSWRAIADICASEACQVYVGLAKERSPHGARWVAAVEQTVGQVLLWNNQPIRAKYSSSNGGESVYGGRPYLPRVYDPHDAYSPQHRWRSTLPLDQVGAAVGLPGPPDHVGLGPGAIGLYVIDEATGQTTAQKIMGLDDFRSVLNTTLTPPAGVPRAVPSTRFRAAVADGALVLDGMGFGHGIGMSQWGAYGKAVQGWSAPQILSSYYGGVAPIRPASLPDRIRVALAVGEGRTTLSGGPFRLVTPSGELLAVAAGGTWTVERATGGVRIMAGPDATIQPAEAAPEPAPVAAAAVARPAPPPPLAAAPPSTELAARAEPEHFDQSWAEGVAALFLVAISVACAYVASTGRARRPRLRFARRRSSR